MLTFNLKKEWFEKIKSGEKTHEYRVANDYWEKRVKKNICDKYNNGEFPILIKFALGYPAKEDKEKNIIAKVVRIRKINGKYTDLRIDKDVIDIEFELIKEE